MLFDGVRGQLTFARAGKFSRCQSAMPLASWVRTRLESRLLATEPRPADPVPELAADVDCSETLAGAGWHAPWILRGAKERTNMSAEWILRHHSKRLETVMAVDMAAWAERWAEIDDCPVARKKLHAERPLAEVLSQNSSLYAAFDEGFLDANQKTFGELRSQMLSLRDLCGFQGWGGEAFFGFGAEAQPYATGSPYHAALFGNLFLQVEGERTWTLIAPWYSQLMRPLHGTSHVLSSVYDDWVQPARRAHLSRLPRYTVTMRPGDVLFVPPWWWHEVVLGAQGFSFGVSTRGMGMRGAWHRWPILRFLPPISGGPWTADGLALDLVHGVLYASGMVRYLFDRSYPLGWLPVGVIEAAQHLDPDYSVRAEEEAAILASAKRT